MNNYKNDKARAAKGKRRSRPYNKKEDKSNMDKSAQYEVRSGKETTKHNDASWYNKGSQLVLDAGRLAYAQPLGAIVDLGVSMKVNGNSNASGKARMPGVMELRYVPTIGVVSEEADPVNVSMRNIYSWIRHANSGHVNYDAPDLMLYLLAMDSLYQLYAHMCRIYGMVRLYSQTNRHLPFTVFKALGVDYSDILANLSDFRAFINTVGVRLGSFAVPSTMDYFTRHLWMASGIYMDAPTTKAQAYVFTPGILGYYDETGGPGKLVQETTLTTNRNMKFADFVTLTNTLLNAIVASEDIGIMSGDILKAYTTDQLIKVLTIADDFTVIPAYSEEVLRQIQNATIFDGAIGFDSGNYIYQDTTTNTLRSGVTVYVHNEAIGGRRFMLSNVESPSPDEVMVDSRLAVIGEVGSRSAGTSSSMPEWSVAVSSCGSEIIYAGWIHNMTEAGTYYSKQVESYPGFQRSGVTNCGAVNALDMLCQLSMFEFHPFMYLGFGDTTTVDTSPNYLFTVGDLSNYTVVDDIEIQKLHTAALLSLFNVPQIGR